MPVPVHVDPSPVRELAAPLASVQPHAMLQVQADGGPCTLARLDAEGRAPLLDATLAAWLVQAGYRVAVSIVPAEDCDGLPAVESLQVPAAGWLIGLTAPARAVDAAGTLSVVQVGEDARWWLVAGTGEAQLAVNHGDAPPTRFRLTFGDGQAAEPLVVPLGGAAVVPGPALGAPIAEVVQADIAAARVEGAHVIVIGRASGRAVGAVRDGEFPPVPFLADVGRPLGPGPNDVTVRVNGVRRLALDVAPDSAWVADERLVTVELRGERVILTGRRPGRTHLVVRIGTEVYLVPVAVG